VSTNPNHTANKRGGPDLSQCFVAAPSLATLPPISDSHPKASPGAAQYPNMPLLPDTFQEAAPNLMLTVQSRAVAEMRSVAHNMNNPADGGFIGWPYAEHLTICVVYDTADMKLYLTASDVDKWGVSGVEIFQTAYRNLVELPLDFRATFREGRVFRLFADDTYEAARLLLPPPQFEQLPVRGTHVAMVPHPNVLLITGDQDPEGLHIVLREAPKHLREQLAITPSMFRLSNTGWKPWNPELPSADRKEFEGLVLDTLERDYARQQRLLRAQELKKPGNDQLFIASYMQLPKGRSDGLRTLSVWTRNAPSLLPKTDAIAFVTGTEFRGIVPWSVVAAQMENELEPVGTYPARYSALSFPTDEQVRSLIQEAVRRGVSQEP
jgi:hypothetical protein